jgi:hypothetical protein
MQRVVQVLCIVALLAACHDTPVPLVAGQVTLYQDKTEVDHWPLSQDQLTHLSQWLEQHRSAWKKGLGSPPRKHGILALELKRADGKSRLITVKTRRDGSHYLLLAGGNTTDDLWPDQSSWAIFKSRQLQSISEVDRAALDAVVAKPRA